MSIEWDENHLINLVEWVKDSCPLTTGKLSVVSMDIPENCFAGQVDLDTKKFMVYTNLDSSVSDVTLNVFLGYIVAMAYDASGWEDVPDKSVLFDCHTQVCEAMIELNEDFAEAIEECTDILEAWLDVHNATTDTTTLLEVDDLVEALGSSMFKMNPSDDSDYGAN